MRRVERIDFDVLESTQVWMHQMWKELPRDRMTVVVAREQTHGRGRLKGRYWSSPRGNLALTLVVFMEIAREDCVHMAQVAALAVRQAAMAYGISGKKLQLKWPNDIMLDVMGESKGTPKKVGGVLAEVFMSPPHRVCCIGVGLNLHHAPQDLKERPQPVTALFSIDEEARELNYQRVTHTVIEQLVSAVNTFIAEGFSPFLHAYASALMHQIGDRLVSIQAMSTTQGEKKIEGVFLGIDPSGALCLEVEGRKRLFVAGEWN